MALGTYFRNRFARIYPAYFVAVVFSAAVAVRIDGQTVRSTAEQTVVHAMFLHGASGYWFVGLNGAIWSMATEVQFYLVFPVLLWLLGRFGSTHFVLVALFATVAFRIAVTLIPRATTIHGSVTLEALLSMQLPGRVGEFALGMWLASIYVRGRCPSNKVCMSLFLILMPFALLIRWRGPAPLSELALGIAYTPIAALALTTTTGTEIASGAWRRARWLAAAFGRSSYSFFLIHIPVSAVFARWLGLHADASYRSLEWAILALTPPCLIFSIAMYRFIELPLWLRLRINPPARARDGDPMPALTQVSSPREP